MMTPRRTALSAALAACVAGPAAAQDTTLTILMLEGLDTAAMRAVADGYEAANPDVTIEIQSLPWGQFFQVSEMRLRSGDEEIDILYTDAPVVASHAANGYISPFPADVAEAAKAQLVDAAYVAGTFEGELYALPMNSSSQVLYYNIDLLEAAGVTPPAGLTPGSETTAEDIAELATTGRWTYEQVAEAAQAAKQVEDGRTTVWGFSVEQFGELYQLQPLGGGAPMISEDARSASGFLDSAEWIEGATYWSNIFNEWEVSPRALAFGEATQLFINSDIAMFIGGTWNVPAIMDSDVNFGIAPHPYFEGTDPVTPTGSWYLGITEASPDKDVAQDFAQYATLSEEGTNIWFANLTQLPTTTALLDKIDSDPAFDSFPESVMRLSAYESRNTAQPRPLTEAFGQLQDAFRTAFVDIANGIAVEDALYTAVESYDSAARRLMR